MARLAPSMTSDTSMRDCCLCLTYSLKPASKMLAMPWDLRLPAPRLSNNLFKSPPAQKAASNSSALLSARLMVANLMKIYHQENKEVRINTTSTNCTGRLAPATSEKIDMSFATLTVIGVPVVFPIVFYGAFHPARL